MKTEVGRAARHQKRDFTSGGLHRNIWTLSGPMILEMGVLNVTQLMDTYWVGKLGSAALAAVTIGITVRWVINSLSNGLGIGGMAVVARRIGGRDQAAAEDAAWQTILLGIFASVLLGGLGLLLARPILGLLKAEPDVLPLGMDFLRVAFAGLFTLILVFVINALLRGAGEAKLAMAVLSLTTLTNVVLEPALVFGFGPIPALGVAGSAWAYVLGFGAGLLLQLIILLSGRARIRINPRQLKPNFALMGQIIEIAFPSTVQMSLRAMSRLTIISFVGFYGTFATAGYGVANRLLLVALIPCFGLANAAGTLVGQNLGADKPQRAESSAWWVSAYGAGYIATVAAILFFFSRPLIALFDNTPEVVAMGSQCLRVVAPSLTVSAVGVILARAFDGAGNTVPAMMVNLLSLWVIEVPAAYGLAHWLSWGINGIWWGRAIANLSNGVFFALWFRRGAWKKKKL